MMTKEKQIEELGKEIYQHCSAGLFEDEANAIAEFVINKQGYRKASEVARETVEAIKNEVSKKRMWVSEFDGCAYGGYVILTTDIYDIVRRYMFDTYEEAKLKKKYAEDGERDRRKNIEKPL
jgi:hypothetical protein